MDTINYIINNKYEVAIIINVILLSSLILSILSLIISIISLLNSIKVKKYTIINDFFKSMEQSEFIEARNYVYNYIHKDNEINNHKVNIVVNFFHHWGYLAKNKFLPMNVFESGSGEGVLRLYSKCENYIYDYRRIHKDIKYAEYFEWLNKEIGRQKSCR